jgi:RNA polymerase sigma-70 factor (ECF subfamily)
MRPAELDEFVGLIVQYQVGLRAFIRALGVHSDGVDDLAQEAFLTAWRLREKFDRKRDFGKWIRGIARNLTLNEARKTARRSRIMSERLTKILDATSAERQPADETEIRARLNVMQECLDRVPENTRSILVRRYQHGEPAVKLADYIGASVDAVRQTLCRVRKALRDCVEERLEMLKA